MSLTDTQRLILSNAADHPAGFAAPPPSLPPAPRAAVAKALLKAGLLTQVKPAEHDAAVAWKLDGEVVVLALTEAGRAAVAQMGADVLAGHVKTAGENETANASAEAAGQQAAAATVREAAPPHQGRRRAAEAMLPPWDTQAAMEAPLAALRAALTKPVRGARPTGSPRTPREGTKQQAVLALLRRPEGATVAQIADATGWQAHTVRGFFAGLKKRGIEVSVLERVRQIGPNQQGAKGSYSIYRLTEAG
jgi:Protein of unknown function (DUF3489)